MQYVVQMFLNFFENHSKKYENIKIIKEMV